MDDATNIIKYNSPIFFFFFFVKRQIPAILCDPIDYKVSMEGARAALPIANYTHPM